MENISVKKEYKSMQITPKARLISIIIALVFMFGALVGTGAYLIINHINNANALNSESNYSIGNMIKSGDNDFIDNATYQALMTKLGNDTTSTRKKSAINGGTPIVFQMGTVPGTSTPIYWEVVYQTGDTITVWMTQSYTTGQFNPDSTDGSYLYNANYSSSYLRRDTLTIYNELNTAYPVFSKVVKSPSDAGVSSWQNSQGNAKYNSSCWSITNGLGTNSNSGSASLSDINDRNPYSWSWTSCMSDMFWIPSHYEVRNTSTSGSGSSTNGLWGLSTTDFASTTTTLKGSVPVSDCWLRSGYSGYSGYAMLVSSSGSARSAYVSDSPGVRPACHISLSALANAALYTITAQSNNANYGTVSGGGTYNLGETVILTATPNAGCQLKGWSLDGGSTIIAGSEGKTDYQITVTADATYTAVFLLPIYLNITGNSGTYTSKIDYNSETENATIIIHPDSNDYINTIWLDSNTPQIVNKWSDYIYQDGAAFNVSYEVTDFSNTIIVNIKLLEGEIAININFAQFPPVLEQGGGTSISGVALQVSASGGSTDLAAVGEARITGYNQTEGLTTVHVSAVASTGYRFVGWQVDGETISTLLSADISYSDVEGKILVAVFAPIDNNTQNSQTDNGYIDDFV